MRLLTRNVVAVAIVLAGTVFLAGSGAFTAIAADRTATINVAGDDSALLEISPHPSANPSDVFTSSGQLRIEVSAGSTTDFDPLFNITNRGTEPVAVWIEDVDYVGVGGGSGSGGDIIGDLDADNTANVTFYNATFGGAAACENGVKSIEDVGNAVQLGPGQTLVVSLYADSSSVPGDEADLLDEMTIYADASVTGQSSPTPAC